MADHDDGNELRDTDLMGPTRLGWKREADDLWSRRHEEPELDPWRWVAIAKECFYLLKRRDDEVAELLAACKLAYGRLTQHNLRCGSQGEADPLMVVICKLDPDWLPELSPAERAAMDALPEDFVEKILAGKRPLSRRADRTQESAGWSAEPPTRDGWYWVEDVNDKKVVLKELYMGWFYETGEPGKLSITYYQLGGHGYGSNFCGPLTPPGREG